MGSLAHADYRSSCPHTPDPIRFVMSTTQPADPMSPAVRPIPQAGDAAPDFTLASTSGEKTTLSSFQGRRAVLLAFFPLAFTSTCTSELCAFSDDFDGFTSADIEVLPISVDAVPSLAEYKRKYEMKTDLLSDFRREASMAYGVLREDTYFANRAYFLIDKSGVVRWAHVESSPGQRRENEEIFAAIRSTLD